MCQWKQEKIWNKYQMINSNEEEWVFGGYGSWKVVSRGWVLEKNKWESLICGEAVSGRHLQTRLLVCSQSDKVRWCCLALMKTSNFPIFFFFFSSLRQHHTDKAAIYKACVQPFVSAQLQLSSTVTGGRIDCALCLTLCFSCHFEVRDQNQDGTQQWQWSASTYQKLQNTAQCNTHSVIQLTQFSHALVANTVMA